MHTVGIFPLPGDRRIYNVLYSVYAAGNDWGGDHGPTDSCYCDNASDAPQLKSVLIVQYI